MTRSDARVVIILNPRAGGGLAARRAPEIRRLAESHFRAVQVLVTAEPGHATALAAQAGESGADLVVAAGGDGTCHEVVNGLVGARTRAPRPAFGALRLGTGSDLVRSLEMPAELESAMRILAHGATRRLDLGWARWEGPTGSGEEAFFNVAGVGANGAVVARADGRSKERLGAASYLLAAAETLWRFEPPTVRLELHDDTGTTALRTRLLALFAANGAWCGGGMWVGRGGRMDDGLLDVTIVKPGPLGARVTEVPRLYEGRLRGLHGVEQHRAARLTVRDCMGFPMMFDLDGEPRIAASITLELEPRTLAARGGWGREPTREGWPRLDFNPTSPK